MTLRGVRRIEQPVIEGLLVTEGYLGKEHLQAQDFY